MRALIIPGGREHFRRLLPIVASRIVGVLLHEEIDEAHPSVVALQRQTPARLMTLSTLGRPLVQADFRDGAVPWYSRVLTAILADPRSHFLATRARVDSAQNNVVDIEVAVANAVNILDALAPTRLICSSTPHSLGAWVLARAAEVMGVPVTVLEMSPVRDRAWAMEGLDAQRVRAAAPPVPGTRPSEAVLAQVRPQMEASAGAMDAQGVPISRMELGTIAGADGNRWWSWARELRLALGGGLARLPWRLLQSGLKRRLHSSYRALEVKAAPRAPFIAFFMHYQPERTTLPEGLGFTQQLLALRILSLAIPAGWRIVVREHPTTWLKSLNPTVRRADYYRRITALGNVDLGGMDIDTFELIDKAQAVATLTGKVGFQSILRGKPAIVFGTAGYKAHPGCYSVATIEQVREAVADIISGAVRARVSRDALDGYLAWVERNSVRAAYDGDDIYELRLRNFEVLYGQLLASDGSGWMIE